jgi:hypothetical protein
MPRSSPPVKSGLTFEDYLSFEETATEKHEFVAFYDGWFY